MGEYTGEYIGFSKVLGVQGYCQVWGLGSRFQGLGFRA